MDEFTAVMKARELVGKVNPSTIPVPVAAYVKEVGAKFHLDDSLAPDESGCSFEDNGVHHICINKKDSPERRNFTTCHELGHIVLGLPSDHKESPWWSYTKRSPNEVFCDVFAAELLLPVRLFKPLADKLDISLAAVDELAGRFEASTMATGSRFATVVATPCAFVLSEKGKVRYASRSKALREANAFIPPGTALPGNSVSERVRNGGKCDGPEEIMADLWFNDWDRGGVLLEDARYLQRWDQTLSLIWFGDDEEVPPPKRSPREEEEEFGLRELDGVLPWPGKKRRR